ncbi:MAG: CPBP family intramembrane metalloprotease [Oscillospiraceae bacterium]|nr:CPBP family intramembrane metalloprotease [Oscillospiraceae bacterium]
MEKRKTGLLVYVLLVFILTGAFAYGVIYPAARAGKDVTVLLTVYMLFPTVAAVLARLISGEGFRDHALHFQFKGHIRHYLLAWLGPGLLVILGAAVYFLFCPGRLDLSAGYLRQIMAESGIPYEAQAVPMGLLLAIQAVQAVLLGGIVNLIPSLGEEWGWRGYMLPRLTERMGRVPALLLGGVIWGLWHAPITAIGHNYGLGYPGFPWTGIAAMCVFCTALGILLWWLTEKTDSVIPAAIAHGAINGAAGLGALFTADGGDPFVGPAPTGILGGLPILILAVLVLILDKPKKEPERE